MDHFYLLVQFLLEGVGVVEETPIRLLGALQLLSVVVDLLVEDFQVRLDNVVLFSCDISLFANLQHAVFEVGEEILPVLTALFFVEDPPLVLDELLHQTQDLLVCTS